MSIQTFNPVNNVHFFEPVDTSIKRDGPVELTEVFPCRCGATHSKDEEYLFRQHICFHEGKLHFIQDKDPDYYGQYGGAKLTCADCGKVFIFEDIWQNCIVCGWMERSPKFERPCPSCGDDHTEKDIEAARALWIATGPVWHSEIVQEPQDWRPMKQLDRLWRHHGRGISLNGKKVAEHRCIIEKNVSGLCKTCGIKLNYGDESHSKDGLFCSSHCPQHAPRESK